MGIPEIFACEVFNDEVMKKTLSKEIYDKLSKTAQDGDELDITVATEVAEAMKNWAISKGATHYTHWFQPMTGFTAEKHDSFICPTSDGKVIMEFSGKELIKGESDASSFPNGGIRATFEARGYTAWDPTSYAFIKDRTLCIPTAFCSYSGEALDKKTPLLRSLDILNKQSVRVLKLLGNKTIKSIKVYVGAEQEYFLIDKNMANRRKDLMYTGRTLFGAKPPKGQELEDHYYGAIKPRIKAFMEDLNESLWKLGILCKTEHNEVAPSQHELAPIYCTVNTACDNNQLTMELLKKVADKHNLVCLLHEKPFAGVNGSGKHNNWSIATDDGVNLFAPGETPGENLQFLVFLMAVIRATDKYQELFRFSVASAGNDHRLGANEAPPAILSIFIGEDLSCALKSFEENSTYHLDKKLMALGTKILPKLPKDTTDRNRTSPLAFTGNKFEFRMVGSSTSIADCNVAINTAVAMVLDEFAKMLENTDDIVDCVHKIVHTTLKENGRIIFNGNNYSSEWLEEATNRGLANLRTTPEVCETFTCKKNIELFEKTKVFTPTELFSRQQIMYENYARLINIEAITMAEMAQKDIYPAVNKYISKLIQTAERKNSIGADSEIDTKIAIKLSTLTKNIYKKAEKLKKLLDEASTITDAKNLAFYYKDNIIPCMQELRQFSDEAEIYTPETLWPFPTYGQLLFSVK